MLVDRYISGLVLTGLFLFSIDPSSKAQNCPPNIDFETGDFTGWTCYTGNVISNGSQNFITFNYSGAPVYDRHTMYSSNPGDGFDPYGNFPRNCPNGSGHSIRLGNDKANALAEGISYDFTIPANANTYNLIYNYAIVFQDPGHEAPEQPRMEIEIKNVTDGTLIGCSSFTFFPHGSPLPGFELAYDPGGNTPVWFKRWTQVSINLDGQAGKTIRLLFKTADCAFKSHFGYAYIDVNTECSDKFIGANFCPDDTAVVVTAPYGYSSYTWHNSTFTQVLGQQQTLTIIPPPPSGTTVAVILIPYAGYGCIDTLFTKLTDTLAYLANAGPDLISCNKKLVQLGVPPKPGWIYKWSPATGLNNPNTSNPLANPDITTTYALSINHIGGGCVSADTVLVKAGTVDNSLELSGDTAWCIGSGDSTILKVPPNDSIQWYKNNMAIPGANQTEYRVTETGTYHAMVFSLTGCILPTISTNINISSIPVAGFTVNNSGQCLVNNKFIFTNTSSNSVGALQYKWIFGDGIISTMRNPSHTYHNTGTYKVVMVVNSNSVCADSTSITVIVRPNIQAAFTVDPVCINLPVLPVNNTIDPGTSPVNYVWDFGNGQTSTLRNPPAQVYPAPGNYVMSLSVSTAQCPFPLDIQKRFVNVDAPRPAVNNPLQIAVVNLPLPLQARPFGDNVLWTPPVFLDNPASHKPVFIGNKEQVYTIEIKTNSGCITVDTQLVKINKRIEIYVPNSFTPNNDGRNDLLRPFMIGIKELTYFKIFNRWGQLIFETNNAQTGWDGRFKGIPIEMQTLIWTLEGMGSDNKIYKKSGSTMLFR